MKTLIVLLVFLGSLVGCSSTPEVAQAPDVKCDMTVLRASRPEVERGRFHPVKDPDAAPTKRRPGSVKKP